DDDASFERVVNTPTRGIGAKSLDDIRVLARDRNLSLRQAAKLAIDQKLMTPRALNAMHGF
ncbi:MAG TPA: hypothetical protein DCZ48_10655, partial [Methylococcaceae bacterium]|nr:hypothetical protein [Methylococcaceae bacterium]